MGIYAVARSRVNRAKAHGERLAQLWNEIPTEHLLKPKALAGPDGHGVIFAAGVGEVPEELPLLLGEQLYQLRSALDACIYQATIYATKQDPPPDEGKLEFPVTSDPTEWPNIVKRRLAALPTKIQDAIKSVQPFNNPTLPPEKMTESINRSLGILHELARKDRHRKLHIVGSWPLDMNPEFNLPDGVTLDSLEILPPSVLREGAIFARFHLTNFIPGTQIPMNPNLRTTIGCDEAPVACHPTDTFGKRLTEMINAVHSVVYAFEQNF